MVIYGRALPKSLPYASGHACTDAVDTLLANRDEFLAEVCTHLLQAQEYAYRYYDATHRALEFAVGDWVWPRLLHRPTQSLAPRSRGKLRPKYAGPYQVLERVGTVAYRLQLSEGTRLHDVFHVGVLKPFHGTPPAAIRALPPLRHGPPLQRPERVLRSSIRCGVWHVLVQWADMPASEATWEPVEEFHVAHPSFQLEDELFPEEGRDVMVGLDLPKEEAQQQWLDRAQAASQSAGAGRDHQACWARSPAPHF
jgi:hypothetical protein